jgi:hypothetical protein
VPVPIPIGLVLPVVKASRQARLRFRDSKAADALIFRALCLAVCPAPGSPKIDAAALSIAERLKKEPVPGRQPDGRFPRAKAVGAKFIPRWLRRSLPPRDDLEECTFADRLDQWVKAAMAGIEGEPAFQGLVCSHGPIDAQSVGGRFPHAFTIELDEASRTAKDPDRASYRQLRRELATAAAQQAHWAQRLHASKVALYGAAGTVAVAAGGLGAAEAADQIGPSDPVAIAAASGIATLGLGLAALSGRAVARTSASRPTARQENVREIVHRWVEDVLAGARHDKAGSAADELHELALRGEAPRVSHELATDLSRRLLERAAGDERLQAALYEVEDAIVRAERGKREKGDLTDALIKLVELTDFRGQA